MQLQIPNVVDSVRAWSPSRRLVRDAGASGQASTDRVGELGLYQRSHTPSLWTFQRVDDPAHLRAKNFASAQVAGSRENIVRVLLVAPPIMDNFGSEPVSIAMDAIKECPPYGMYLLASEVRAHGHDATLVDLIAKGSYLVDDITVADYDLVAVGATSMSWPTALQVVRQIREQGSRVPIVVGGIPATMFDYYILSTFDVDYVVRGEGERALVALADSLEGRLSIESVPNLSWKSESDRVRRNAVAPKLTPSELASCAFVDYSTLPEQMYKGLSIESSRGCGYDCSFCSTSYRKSFRGMPPEAFVDRLQDVLQYIGRTKYPFVHIVDDEFSMNPKRAMSIIRCMEDRGALANLVFDSRATDLLVEEFVPTIAPHTYQFLVGAECGYDDGLQKIGKGTSTSILSSAASRLAKYGLAERADFSFVIGLPWESNLEVRKTCEFALSLHESYGVRILLQWYCQIPGSRLWQDARDSGLVTEAMYNEFGFFRDLYLFRSAVKLSNAEIESVTRLVTLASQISMARAGGRSVVEYAHPEPLRIYYPAATQSKFADGGLGSLRAISSVSRRNPQPERDLGPLAEFHANPNVQAGRPQRHVASER